VYACVCVCVGLGIGIEKGGLNIIIHIIRCIVYNI
jgi:hypothetical protein